MMGAVFAATPTTRNSHATFRCCPPSSPAPSALYPCCNPPLKEKKETREVATETKWLGLATLSPCAPIHRAILGVISFTGRCVTSDFRPAFSTPHPFAPVLQLQRTGNSNLLVDLSAKSISAPVGINPKCGIERLHQDGSLGNIANIAACGISVLVVAGLIFLCERRKAAVGEFPC